MYKENTESLLQIHAVAKDELERLLLLPQPLNSQDYRHESPLQKPVCTVLGFEPGLHAHWVSTLNWATFSRLKFYLGGLGGSQNPLYKDHSTGRGLWHPWNEEAVTPDQWIGLWMGLASGDWVPRKKNAPSVVSKVSHSSDYRRVGFCHIIQFSQLLIVTCMGDCCFPHKCGYSNGHNPRHNLLWKSHLHTTAAIRYRLAF